MPLRMLEGNWWNSCENGGKAGGATLFGGDSNAWWEVLVDGDKCVPGKENCLNR